VERDALAVASAPRRGPAARVVGEQPAHHGGAGREEVRPVPPGHLLAARESQEGLVDERGRLQGVSRRTLPQVPSGEGAEVPVHVVHEAIHGGGLPGAQVGQQLRHVTRR